MTRQIAIGLYDGFTALDALGPYQLLASVPDAAVVLCAAEAGTVVDDNGLLRLAVDATFDDVPTPDVLLVPGGRATGDVIRNGHPIVGWVRTAHPTTTWTVSVCTGALILGAAGVLDGLDATTHWCFTDVLPRYGAVPVPERVVESGGKVLTAAGVSAGLDLGLTLAARLAGDDVAQALQLGLEYDPRPPFDAGSPSTAPPHIRDLVAGLLKPLV